VCDDYRSERKQVLKASRKRNGKLCAFTYGDYVVKCLIGGIDPSIDKQDEKHDEKCLIS